MKITAIKELLVFLFILSIFESAGLSVISVISKNKNYTNLAELVLEEEKTSKESENTKELSLKEFIIELSNINFNAPSKDDYLGAVLKDCSNHIITYFPSVPTPPPDTIFYT